jgi:hypothetical protein
MCPFQVKISLCVSEIKKDQNETALIGFLHDFYCDLALHAEKQDIIHRGASIGHGQDAGHTG